MKRFLTISLFVATLVWSAAGISIAYCDKELIVNDKGYEKAISNDYGSPGKDYAYVVYKIPVLPVGVNAANTARVPVATEETTGSRPFNMMQTCFSLLMRQQFHVVRSTFSYQYAIKKTAGYYIYELRKLLI